MKIPSNFLHGEIEKDLNSGRFDSVHTRFPPEPNGHLHVGSAYAIQINWLAAQKYGGKFNLRMDDTNPEKESMEYVESIVEDMRWLGCDWEDRLFFASDYFEELYDYACRLIEKGLAYVCDLTPAEVRTMRGGLTQAGTNSPYRNRPVEENLRLFAEMKAGKYAEGKRSLRAKIDMASPNMNMRDPVIYRICYTAHYRRGTDWCIYPLYDFQHPVSDAMEGITHSMCSDEFKNHRPLYDWFLEKLEFERPSRQVEFGRINLRGIKTGKRDLRSMVENGTVSGWDDPRMPTIKGLKRRGYTPEMIRDFVFAIGVAKDRSTADYDLLETTARKALQATAPARMVVVHPLKVVITNFPEGRVEMLPAANHPKHPEMGERELPFTREIFIEREDFAEVPPKKFKRLSPGEEVRLRHGYFFKCEEVVKDSETGELIELRGTYDLETKSGSGFTGRKPKGTIHWVSATEGIAEKVRIYDRIYLPDGESINPNSLYETMAILEPSIKDAKLEETMQWVRLGYFTLDSVEWAKGNRIWNRTVSLKDAWKK